MLKPFPYIGADKHLRMFLKQVLDGEYATPQISFEPHQRFTVLDIGANVGSYTYWAHKTWPGATIHAYEPNAANAKSFRANMRGAGIPKSAYKLTQAAVYPTNTKRITLFESLVNSGMHSMDASLTNTAEPAKFTVPAMHPRDLPDCSILKIDAEGVEVPVIREYLATHKMHPVVISYEFHSMFDRYELEEILSEEYVLTTGKVVHWTLGTQNFIHKTLIPKESQV